MLREFAPIKHCLFAGCKDPCYLSSFSQGIIKTKLRNSQILQQNQQEIREQYYAIDIKKLLGKY